MSANRRQYRQAQRDYEKHRRVIDWHKIHAQLKTAAKVLPLAVFICFSVALIIRYFGMRNRNGERQAVMASPATITATVTNVYNRKNSHYATFTFSVGSTTYKGQTFYGYKGHSGDAICVMYNTQQPYANIYCDDATMETFKRDVFIPLIKLSVVIVGGIVAILPLIILYCFITGDKQTIAAVTSKKHG